MKVRTGIVVGTRTGQHLAVALDARGAIGGQPWWSWAIAGIVIGGASLLLWTILP
jgi:hypothetical protein